MSELMVYTQINTCWMNEHKASMYSVQWMSIPHAAKIPEAYFLLASELATAQDRMSWHPQPSCPSLKFQWEWTTREGRSWTEWLLSHPQERMWQRESFYCWGQAIIENTPSWKPCSDKREEVKKYVRSSGLITICLEDKRHPQNEITYPQTLNDMKNSTPYSEATECIVSQGTELQFLHLWTGDDKKNLSWRFLRTSRNYAAQCGLLSSVSLPVLQALWGSQPNDFSYDSRKHQNLWENEFRQVSQLKRPHWLTSHVLSLYRNERVEREVQMYQRLFIWPFMTTSENVKFFFTYNSSDDGGRSPLPLS